jgi:ATP-dependent protease ClpP protease subunit
MGKRAEKKSPRSWYRFNAEADVADLYVYDYIGVDPWTGEGVGAKQFIDELNALPKSVKTITLHVNSPGGSVFDAVAIANALREHRAGVDVSIEGVAASAATIVIMGGTRIRIAENALVMIHNAVGFAWGTAKDMRAEAEALDRVQAAIVATYQWHSKLSADDLVAMMEAVTWMDAEEAVENGFATEVGAAMQAAAHFDPRSAAKLGAAPEKYQTRLDEIVAESTEEEPDAPTAAREDPPAAPAPVPAQPSNVVSITAAREDEIEKQERRRIATITKAFRAMAAQHPAMATAIGELEDRVIEDKASFDAASARLLDLMAASSSAEIRNTVSLFADGQKTIVDAIVKGSKKRA